MMASLSSLVPRPLYASYKRQAEELNLITARINGLIAQCKVRGMYDSTIQGMADVLTAEDGKLIPVDNIAALIAQGLSIEKSIWLVPLDTIVTVLQQLYVARDQVKNTIYEITGIADIMRGASQASETLGAQEIKNQWGTLRLKRSQKRVAQYVRESLRIMLEIAVNKLAPDTWSKMTGLPWPTPVQVREATLQKDIAVQQGQPVPEDADLALKSMQWQEILDLLKDDLSRAYRVDIQTNSTVDAEATEDKQNITDLINAIAQFLNGVAPLVENGSMPFEVAKVMLLTIVRRFRFGPELEDALTAMQPPQPKPDPKQAAIEAQGKRDAEKHQADMKAKEIDFGLKQKEAQGKAALMDKELEIKQMEMELKRQELELKKEEMMLKVALAREQAHAKKQSLDAQTAATQQQTELQMAAGAQQHQNAMELGAATTQAKLATTEASTKATLATANAKQKAANQPKPQGKKP